jgi:hypothetical protein
MLMETDQPPLFEKFDTDVEYDKVIYEEMDVNPYEVVIGLAKKSREVNERALKFFGTEVEFRPKNVAMKKMLKKGAKFTYEEPEKSE